MDKATMKGLLERARETNAQYEAASPGQKRIMIAQDVIAAIRAKHIEPDTGFYFEVTGEFGDIKYGSDSVLGRMTSERPEASVRDQDINIAWDEFRREKGVAS
jgi:hypothetical protein